MESKLLTVIGNVPIKQASGPIYFESGLHIDADGARNAYGPNGLGIDYLANAGKPGNWWGIVTDNKGNPVIQGEQDPYPGYYISTTSMVRPGGAKTDHKTYVDSNAINYIVMPGKAGLGVKLGDFAIVINKATGVHAFAIYADSGPANKIGEGSIALANALGIPSNPKKGGTSKDICYVVFPASSKGWQDTQEQINVNCQKLLDDFGGIDKLKGLFQI